MLWKTFLRIVFQWVSGRPSAWIELDLAMEAASGFVGRVGLDRESG